MSELFAVIAFFLSLAALLLGSEIIRRLNAQNAAIQQLSERLLANEIRAAEQEQSQEKNVKTLQQLERLAQGARNAPVAPTTVAPTTGAAAVGGGKGAA